MAEDKHKQFTQFALQLPQSGNSLILMQCGLHPGPSEVWLRRRPYCRSAAHNSRRGEIVAVTVYPGLCHCYFPAVAGTVSMEDKTTCLAFFRS